jgi:hypothetical protein
MVERAHARAHAREFVHAWVRLRVCAFCANDMQHVAVCWCAPHRESWTLDKHPQAYVCRIQQPCPRLRAFPARSAHRIRPIARLAGGWILTTRIVRCVLLAPINLPRVRNLPRRRLSSRAEGRQKPKSAPDDAPVRLRWPTPGTSETLDAQLSASGERWKRPGSELGGAARGGCGLGRAVPKVGRTAQACPE